MSLQGGYSLAKSKSQSVLRTTSSRRLRFQRSYNSTTLHSYQLNKCLTVSRSKLQHKAAVFSAKAQYPVLVVLKQQCSASVSSSKLSVLSIELGQWKDSDCHLSSVQCRLSVQGYTFQHLITRVKDCSTSTARLCSIVGRANPRISLHYPTLPFPFLPWPPLPSPSLPAPSFPFLL